MTLIQSAPLTQRTKRTVGRVYQSMCVMFAISMMMLGGICTRLAYLQLVEGGRNRQLAEDNRIRLIPSQPARGNIFDRNGKVIASSRISHTLFLWPLAQKPKKWRATLSQLAPLVDRTPKSLIDQLERAGYNSLMPVRVQRSLTPNQVTALEEYSRELVGVEVNVEGVRTYPYGTAAAHVLGYTGEVDEYQLEQAPEKEYRIGDIVGQLGIEAALEHELRGEWGGRQVEVDSRGQVIQVIGEKRAKGGRDVQLTLDIELQKAAEAVLGETKGAIVAIDPRNGEVLAMVSRPGFDPNLFSRRMSDKDWQELQDADHPFVNRALQGFPPASTFKIVTTTAAIESEEFSPYTVLPTYPYITVGGIQFWDWNNEGFGYLGFPGAMAWSSDTFFYQIAQGIGGKTLIDWTRRYGFGSLTGIELAAEESPGLVPDNDWKEKMLGESWFLGDTINMSIGQGYLQASPLQVAVMFAVPANGGYRVKPHLVKKGSLEEWRESLNLMPETLEMLQQGLREVVTNGTGTKMASASLPPTAGKSGTAEAPPYESHTWFGAYAPYDDPEVAIVAFGEHSGEGGGSFAAPMVRQVMETYFNLKAQRGGG
ncbi:MAG: penicillin-binding protein 2 [Cyanobacteriota bacterium]|nr:penicillin-binding protein 2 [Cyanobacteriota bacterium]